MEIPKIEQFFNVDQFHQQIDLSTEKNCRFFTVKLKDRKSGEYEETVYLEVLGEIKDSEINSKILNFLEPKYGYVGSIDIYEI